ncbi:MAG TPA: hypothetical protein VKM55_03905 [Candidatus Lokiarchaeia archaeon]|nr:hypothetical protein [Candidatus Lokiarchaeia archaeon]
MRKIDNPKATRSIARSSKNCTRKGAFYAPSFSTSIDGLKSKCKG